MRLLSSPSFRNVTFKTLVSLLLLTILEMQYYQASKNEILLFNPSALSSPISSAKNYSRARACVNSYLTQYWRIFSKEVVSNNVVNQWSTVYDHRSRVIGIVERRVEPVPILRTTRQNPFPQICPSSHGHNISR